ncbi:MAG: hypothetical protein ACQES8_07830 [Thermodesulfobacteriota bacterium]
MSEKKEKTEYSADTASDENMIGEMEPWESWETKLTWLSILIGAGVLLIGGIVVQTFVL